MLQEWAEPRYPRLITVVEGGWHSPEGETGFDA